jgi:hypothetical protein
MKLTKAIKEELVQKVFAKTERAAEASELKKELSAAMHSRVVGWVTEKFPEFCNAVFPLPKSVTDFMDGTAGDYFSVSCDAPEKAAMSALFGRDDNNYSNYYVSIQRVIKPLHVNTPNWKLSDEQVVKILAWHEKYTTVERELRAVLDQCNTKAKLETLLPDVAKLLPEEVKGGLPAILPDAAISSLASVGFPGGVAA